MPTANFVSLAEAVERAARWHPDNDAVIDGVCRLTYRELRDRAGRCARMLHDHGVRRGDRIALLMHPSAMHTVAVLGALELGAVPSGLHTRESEATLRRMMDRLSPTVLVYDESLAPLAASLAAGSLRRPVVVSARSSVEPVPAEGLSPVANLPADLDAYPLAEGLPGPDEDDAAVIVFSSGTTSVPKGVVHSHRSMMETVKGLHVLWHGIRPEDRLLCTASVSFVAWPALVLPFLAAGATVVLQTSWDPAEFLRLLERERITSALLVGTVWRMVLSEDVEGHDLSSLRMIGTGGEPLDERTLTALRERICPEIFSAYGSSESSMAGTYLRGHEMTGERLLSAGRPFPGADLRIVTAGGSPDDVVEPGESGEVLLSGVTLAKEIFDDPAKTAASFAHDGRQRWWRSRDCGRLDADGYLFLEGRIDDMIISGGINVFPALVENVLMAHPGVRACAVVGVPDERWGQRICAYVEPSGDVSEEDLDAFARESELAGYQRPRSYEFVDVLPRTTTSKVDRRKLRDMAVAPA